jgi:hypothetical protein
LRPILEPPQEALLISGPQMLNVVEDHGSGVVQRSRLEAGIARDLDDGKRKSGLHMTDPVVGRTARAGQ